MRISRIIYYCLVVLAFCAVACTDLNNDNPKKGKQVVEQMPKSTKRGVAFSFTNLNDLPLLSPYISWDYNWGNTPLDDAALWFDANDMDFCPMCWNGSYSADRIRQFVAAHPRTKYLLAFNEPNLTDQANMTPKQAAALWQPVVELAKELNLKLVSPAMNYGTLAGYSDPIKWLDEFFAQPEVSTDDIYAISIHCYMASVSALEGYVKMFEKYNKPLWLTEFCAWDPVPGNVDVQMNYMCGALNFLETSDLVERYSWFIPRANGKVDSAPYMQLLTHDAVPELTPLGQMYCLFSSMDPNIWLRAERAIYASEYTCLKNNSMTLRPTTDTQAVEKIGRNGLMITNFAAGQDITYQLYCSDKKTELTLRYCGYSNSICEILLDGKSQIYVDMPRNGNTTEWVETTAALPVGKGYHTLTLSLYSGSCYLSTLQLK